MPSDKANLAIMLFRQVGHQEVGQKLLLHTVVLLAKCRFSSGEQ